MPAPGEPLFLEEDYGYLMALAEEEADTCPSCGLLKAVCRDPAYQFGGFEANVETCWATHRVAVEREKHADAHDTTKAALQISPRYAEGREPAADVGLGLVDDEDEDTQHGTESD